MNTIPTTQPIMAHLVLGYPTLEDSIATACRYVEAGFAILELQIPFSHPTADGPVITAACQWAVEKNKVSVDDAFAAIQVIRDEYPAQRILLMSYLNRIFAYGIPAFAKKMQALGIDQMIVPDLPVDSTPARQLREAGVALVPVIAANITPARLSKLLDTEARFFYLMSDFKITGSAFSLHPRLAAVIEQIRAARPEAHIGIGFGISTPEQVRLVTSHADYAIVGSALIQARREGRLDQYITALKDNISV